MTLRLPYLTTAIRRRRLLRRLSALTSAEVEAYRQTAKATEEASFVALPIGDVLRIIVDASHLVEVCVRLTAERSHSVMAFFDTQATLEAGVKWLGKELQAMQRPLDVKEQAASSLIKWQPFAATVLTDMVEFYGLHSTADAERLPLSDWYLIAKRRANVALYEFYLAKERERQLNAKSR